MKNRGIEARSFWKPVHLQEPYKSAPNYLYGKAEKLWNRIVTLPCSTCITEEELDTVADSVRVIINDRKIGT